MQDFAGALRVGQSVLAGESQDAVSGSVLPSGGPPRPRRCETMLTGDALGDDDAPHGPRDGPCHALTRVGLAGRMPLPWWQAFANFAYAMVSCLVVNGAVKGLR